MAYPLARVWDEPHACVNVCGVVLSIRDEMTAKQHKRRLELELRDGTHAVTCVFWGAAAEATATTVARLDVVSVDVRDAARDGAGLACQCRSAARVRWRFAAGAAAPPGGHVGRAVAWAAQAYARDVAALRAAAARPAAAPAAPPEPAAPRGATAATACSVAEAVGALRRPANALFVSGALGAILGKRSRDDLAAADDADVARDVRRDGLAFRVDGADGASLECRAAPPVAAAFLGSDDPDDATLAARYRTLRGLASDRPHVLLLARRDGDDAPTLLRAELLRGGVK